MKLTLQSAVSEFGKNAKAKLNNPAARGEPEDQLRSPVEDLVKDMAELCGLTRSSVTPVGETAIKHLKSRPDYAVTVQGALVGHLEIKAPGKGADPNRFKDLHDREQWDKLRSLPNLMYTDGNSFSLWHFGEPVGAVEKLIGDVETSGAALDAPSGLHGVFAAFLTWKPIPPRDAKQLAATTARLCRLLRNEVAEQLALGSEALTSLAASWRELLFPDADDAQFADGYAQAVTFGLLMARAHAIYLSDDLEHVGRELGKTDSLIGTALRLLTDDVENQKTLETSLKALTRVLGVVDWKVISKGKPDAWLYFYEDFLEIYDNDLRKQTGSYYTPPEVVAPMVRLVDEVLQHEGRFNLGNGLASEKVKIVDPAVGTGTFLLGVLRRIAQDVEADKGGGAVPAEIEAAVGRLIAFEIQLGPFAVAQLRTLAEVADLTEKAAQLPLRMFVTDTLDNPYGEPPRLRGMEEKIAQSRRDANIVKRSEAITVVIGNPPYHEEAKGLGGWVESGAENSPELAPLKAWFPPPEWGVGVHSRHLYNLYIYFLRWATWKVFDHDPNANTGVVCFITIASFLRGDGFQRMRDYLRRTAQEIWVIDCTPEGLRPEVSTRVFPGVSQPICIVLVSRPPGTDPEAPATVRYHALPRGSRKGKFADLEALSVDGEGWLECSSGWRAAFSPKPTVEWSGYPTLKSFFGYNGTGAMLGRTWIVAPDARSLQDRWEALTHAPADRKEDLFFPHLLPDGSPGDRHSRKALRAGLPGYPPNGTPVADDQGPCVPPIRYGFRSFDRQWIIPDYRLINRPNPRLWAWYSERQVYLTAPEDKSPTSGPALTFTACIPDAHHYNGRGGRVFPLWGDREGLQPNMSSELLRWDPLESTCRHASLSIL